jgi:tetratricopeptide (TPR) repeat protein
VNGNPNLVLEEHEVTGRVHALIDRERFDQARQVLHESLKRFPDSEEIIYLTSYVDWRQGRLDDAEKSLRHLLLLNPEHYGGRIQSARLLVSRGDIKCAEHAWRELLSAEPDNADFYGEYAELMLGGASYLKAIELSAEGLRHQPEHEHCLYVAAIAKMLQYGQLDDNVELGSLIREHPERVRSAFALVLALEKKRKYREAFRVCQQMLAVYPNSPEWLRNARTFKVLSHWSMLPLYPFQRSGFIASVVAWFLICFALAICVQLIPEMSMEAKGSFVWAWLIYALYCWVWPPIFRSSL